jgi:7-cyano-7-deazaguanine synthase in queuosine biosynthesis
MPETLVLLSGGLDSAAMTHLLLKDSTDNQIHIHHIDIKNEDNRWMVEKVVVNNILNYFRNNGYPKFVYSETSIEFPSFNGNFLYDTDCINFFSGYIASVNPNIKQVAYGAIKSDVAQIGSSKRFTRARDIFRAFTDVEKTYPLKDYDKKDLADMIPKELLELTWSCRTPIYENEYAIPCKLCQTCGVLSKAGITQNKIHI